NCECTALNSSYARSLHDALPIFDITALSHALSKGFDEVLEGWRGAAGKKADPRHGRLLGISDEGTEAQHQHENEHRRDKERCRQFVLHHLPPVIAFAMTAHTQRR